jgi:V/A-type H+-transporting ATPase subunit G/H
LKENNSVVNLQGYTFARVKLGLDEEQVKSVLSQLLDEREKLHRRQEHLSSLFELAEKTVAEADNLAKRIEEETLNKAEAESQAILNRAEEQVQQQMEGKRAELLTSVQKEVDSKRASAEKQLETILKEKVEKLQSDLRNVAQRLSKEIQVQAESLKEQATTFEANFQRDLSELAQVDYRIIIDSENDISTEIDLALQPEAVTAARISDEPAENLPTEEAMETTTEQKKRTDLEILPPRDKDQIAEIKSYLDSLPAVTATKLKHGVDSTFIQVSSDESIDLLETLRNLPQIFEVEQAKNGGMDRIQITLSAKVELELEKARLQSRINGSIDK